MPVLPREIFAFDEGNIPRGRAPDEHRARGRRSAREREGNGPAAVPELQSDMWFAVRLAVALVFCLATESSVLLSAEEKPVTEQDYEREELGVNPYTAPSIARIFQQLDELKPLPFDQLKRAFSQPNHASRQQMGMIFGGLVADGFLLVECEKKDLVDDLGRILLRQARSLGVADRVIRHSASLTELGRRGEWAAARKELTATQADVEQAMIELRDQKMAHLISLGGWLRGLEISAGAVEADFSPERARALLQPDLVNYFSEELKTLPPFVAHSPLFERIRAGMNVIKALIDQAPPAGLSAGDVKKIHDEARELNLTIQRTS